MNKRFDMELFLDGVLTGPHATRQRHLRQAKAIHAAIAKRWQRETPWGWKRKHLAWFLEHQCSRSAGATRYYYLLTAKLLAQRLQKPWAFALYMGSDNRNQ